MAVPWGAQFIFLIFLCYINFILIEKHVYKYKVYMFISTGVFFVPIAVKLFFVLQFLKLEKELMKVFKDGEVEIVSNTIMALLFCECEHHSDS